MHRCVKKMCFPKHVFMSTLIFAPNEIYTAMEVAKKLKFKTARTAKKFMLEHGITYYKDTGIGRGKGLRWLGRDLNMMFESKHQPKKKQVETENRHGYWKEILENMKK